MATAPSLLVSICTDPLHEYACRHVEVVYLETMHIRFLHCRLRRTFFGELHLKGLRVDPLYVDPLERFAGLPGNGTSRAPA